MTTQPKLSWAELNQTTVDTVKAPPTLPNGHYAGLIVGQYETGNSEKKGTPFVTYQVKLIEPKADVDEQEFAALEGDPLDKTRDLTYYLTPNSLFMVTDFAKELGCSDQATVMQAIEHIGTCGEPIVVKVGHEPNERNPDRPFVRIQGAMAATTWDERAAQQSAG